MNPATQNPKRYFGLHMSEGTAHYAKKNLTIFLSEKTIKEMNPSFEGCPVFVGHVDEVTLDVLNKADGVVVKSFYNEVDGKNWVEFMVTSDRGHEAIQKGFRLSNTYSMLDSGPGGLWHGSKFDKEITRGKYDHLAIVDDPRYDESIVLTPEQFKEYCDKKREEIKKLSNEKEKVQTEIKETPSMFKMFKREKIDNAADLENTLVLLPLSKKEMTIANALSVADKFENMQGYANSDHMVKADEDEEMSVNELVEKYKEMKNKMKNMIDKPKEEEKKAENEVKDESGKADLKKEEKDEKAKNSKDSKGNFEKVMNASGGKSEGQAAIMMTQKLARGKLNY